MPKPIHVLDQDAHHCGLRMSRDEADGLVRRGLAVQHANRRGVSRNVIRLTRPLSVVNGGKLPRSRSLRRTWMNAQRYVVSRKVYVERDGRPAAFDIYEHKLPAGYGSVEIKVPTRKETNGETRIH